MAARLSVREPSPLCCCAAIAAASPFIRASALSIVDAAGAFLFSARDRSPLFPRERAANRWLTRHRPLTCRVTLLPPLRSFCCRRTQHDQGTTPHRNAMAQRRLHLSCITRSHFATREGASDCMRWCPRSERRLTLCCFGVAMFCLQAEHITSGAVRFGRNLLHGHQHGKFADHAPG